MNKTLLQAFEDLHGRPPNDAEVSEFLKIQKTLGLADNDAMWLVIFELRRHSSLPHSSQRQRFFDRATLSFGLISLFLGFSCGALTVARLIGNREHLAKMVSQAVLTSLQEQQRARAHPPVLEAEPSK